MPLLRGLFTLVILAALAMLAWLNRQDSVLHGFAGFDWQAPLILQLLAAFVLGALLASLLLGLRLLALRWDNRKLRKQLQQQQQPSASATGGASRASVSPPSGATQADTRLPILPPN